MVLGLGFRVRGLRSLLLFLLLLLILLSADLGGRVGWFQ